VNQPPPPQRPEGPPPYAGNYSGSQQNPWPSSQPVYVPSGPPGVAYGGDLVAPPVLLWFRLYMVFATLQYLSIGAFGIAGAVSGGFKGKTPQPSDVVVGIVCIGIGLVFATPHAILVFAGRHKWVHTMGTVVLALSIVGGGGCCSLPALALIIFWTNAETRRWFEGG
jgi:hypothetical protein